MNPILAIVEKEEARNIESIYGRLTALNNFVMMLADNKELFDEKNYLYEKLVQDFEKTHKKFDEWWKNTATKYNLEGYGVGNLNINFHTGEIVAMNR